MDSIVVDARGQNGAAYAATKSRSFASLRMTSSGFFGPLSKKQLQSKLNQPWVPSPYYCTKGCAVADVAVWVHKLRVIEQVEGFGAKLKEHAFAEGCVLEQRKIEVVNPRTATDGSRRVSDDAELRRLSEARWIKRI